MLLFIFYPLRFFSFPNNLKNILNIVKSNSRLLTTTKHSFKLVLIFQTCLLLTWCSKIAPVASCCYDVSSTSFTQNCFLSHVSFN